MKDEQVVAPGEAKDLSKDAQNTPVGGEQYYTYMLECADGSFYTGWTVDIEHRLKAHNGLVPGGAKYTRGRRPVTLVWYTTFSRKQDAQSMEYQVKRMARDQKRALKAAFAAQKNS
ncbi:MAG: GIY-YIG nuclease family protein [Veillonella caviae]|nr:GIY-YIG nuclease family protein [Veillonella caviae]